MSESIRFLLDDREVAADPGESVSRVRQPAEGMKVTTASERVKASRKMVFELLMADQPAREGSYDPAAE